MVKEVSPSCLTPKPPMRYSSSMVVSSSKISLDFNRILALRHGAGHVNPAELLVEVPRVGLAGDFIAVHAHAPSCRLFDHQRDRFGHRLDVEGELHSHPAVIGKGHGVLADGPGLDIPQFFREEGLPYAAARSIHVHRPGQVGTADRKPARVERERIRMGAREFPRALEKQGLERLGRPGRRDVFLRRSTMNMRLPTGGSTALIAQPLPLKTAAAGPVKPVLGSSSVTRPRTGRTTFALCVVFRDLLQMK